MITWWLAWLWIVRERRVVSTNLRVNAPVVAVSPWLRAVPEAVGGERGALDQGGQLRPAQLRVDP